MIQSLLFFSVLSLIISKVKFYKIPGLKTSYLILFFTLKSLSSWLVWIYFFHKPGFGPESDMYQFFKVANELHNKLNFAEELKVIFGFRVSDFSQRILSTTEYWHKLHDYGVINDNRLMIRINMFVRLLFGESYIFHSLIFTFIGFNGLFFLVKLVQSFTEKNLLLFAAIIFISPSGLIWTSNMFKETVVLFTIGGASYFLIQTLKSKFNIYFLLVLFFLLILLLHTKPLFSFLFLYSFVCYLIHRFLIYFKRTIPYLPLFFIPLLLLTLISSFLPVEKNDISIREGSSFDLPLLLKNKQDDFLFDVQMFKPQTVLPLNKIDGTFRSVLQTVPDALHNIFIAPFKMSIKKWEMIPFALEISLLLLLFILSWKFPEPLNKDVRDKVAMLMYPSILSLFIVGLIMPIEGLLVKYAAPPMIILIWSVSIRINWDNLRENFQFKPTAN